jgi:hypothetical protein
MSTTMTAVGKEASHRKGLMIETTNNNWSFLTKVWGNLAVDADDGRFGSA